MQKLLDKSSDCAILKDKRKHLATMDNDFLNEHRFKLSEKALQQVALLIKLHYDLKECFFIIAKKHARTSRRKKNYQEIEIKHKELQSLHERLVAIISQMEGLLSDTMEELKAAADWLNPENTDTPHYGSAYIEKDDVEYYLSLASYLPTTNNNNNNNNTL